ncbi:MAG: glutamine amidotransferase family protein [Pseudomonadota bacterium]
MCGVVGLFLKDKALEPQLGALLTDMLVTMTGRGPDSAGIAVYRGADDGQVKLTVQSANPDVDFAGLADTLGASVTRCDTHAIISCAAEEADAVRTRIAAIPALRLMSTGDAIEIYKEVGLPAKVAERFDIPSLGGTHGIGHTRMATESAVTTLGAHPFSTGPDQCLVHNGALSNHNSLRRDLEDEGVEVMSACDTEAAAAFLTWKMQQGANLGEALEASLDALDGCYTFVVGTKEGFAVLRDPVACKPAVLAETDQYVALGSEFRALANLPGIDDARIWEPEPATVYVWERQA